MNTADITACVRNLPETTAIPLTLTKHTVCAGDFMRWPHRRESQMPLAMIEAAVAAGQTL